MGLQYRNLTDLFHISSINCDVGSDWTQTEITHTIKQKGKKIVHKTHIPMFGKKGKEKGKKK